MLNVLATLLLPPLLVFGVYHLLTWANLFNIGSLDYWKRVAWASTVSYVLLLTGFLVFTYFDYRAGVRLEAALEFGPFLFNRSEFWRFMSILGTAPLLVILGLFAVLDQFEINPPQLVVLTIAIAYVAGMFQWFWVGGGIGAVLDRFWEGLKTGDEEDEDWL